ncbi:Tfp pilus assembly protein FimT/FimU [uncultured Eubacterium sp.]|uniref:pilus assembly FimT family protein n=1 Tax=uncultured Eubacterium sp. TaxID=165185 RepID=UPI0015AE46DE|nr:hypothetical protein [uncultured Eubacterium sp.]
MTNTNDFRRYSYQHDTSYMIKDFNLNRSSAAPKHREIPETEKKLKLRENKAVKTSEQILKDEKLGFKNAVVLLGIAAVVIALVGFTLHSFALKNELTREVSSMQTQISYAQSEGISLNSRLDAMVSIGTIDDYAVNELHMTKMKPSQIQYMDVEKYKQERMEKIKNERLNQAQTDSGNN